MSIHLNVHMSQIMCTALKLGIRTVANCQTLCWGGGEVEPPIKFSKKGGGGLDRISIFRGGLLEKSDFFQGEL